jgi:hypothetical protein
MFREQAIEQIERFARDIKPRLEKAAETTVPVGASA